MEDSLVPQGGPGGGGFHSGCGREQARLVARGAVGGGAAGAGGRA